MNYRPEAIQDRSFEIIDAEVPEPRPFHGDQWLIARRIIHASADLELLGHIRFHPGAITRGIDALLRGCTIITDTEMARAGITAARMDRLGCEVRCLMNAPEVREMALRDGTTRASAAVDCAIPYMHEGICVIGNAPTALIRLLEVIKKNRCMPALIVGMPVGFVNAAESKEMLMAQTAIPYITIEGRKGGSALAASVVNQLAEMALQDLIDR